LAKAFQKVADLKSDRKRPGPKSSALFFLIVKEEIITARPGPAKKSRARRIRRIKAAISKARAPLPAKDFFPSPQRPEPVKESPSTPS
jgi:hypothetical protein